MPIDYLKVVEDQIREADGQTKEEVENNARLNTSALFKRTDFGNAERLVAGYGGVIRYCPPRNKWLLWNSSHWEWDETKQIEVLAKKTVRRILDEAATLDSELYKEVLSHAMKSENAAKIRAMIDLAESEPGIPILPNKLDKDPWLLNVKNGTLDLRTGMLRPPHKGDLITKMIDIEYDPAAKCPIWLEFLNKVMDGNEGLISFLQQAVGYSLTGDIREQCLFFLYGRGANGKSTFIEAITGLLGPYSKHTRPETFMAKKSDGVPNDQAELENIRMVAAVELEEGRRLAEVIIKQFSGGDKVKTRFLFQEYFEYYPQFKIWLCGNHKPRIHGTDHAIWRRIRLIPWMVTIPDHEQDKNLPNKLKAEWPGILTWAIQGCLEWQVNGLSTPKEVQAATADYRKEMDVLGDFFENCVITDTNESITVKDLYDVYVKFSEDNGESVKERLGKKKFNERIADRGFDQFRAGKNKLTWAGLVLRED